MHCASSLRTDPTLTLTPGWQIEWMLDKTGNEYLLRRPLHRRRVQSEHILWHKYLILYLMDISMESFTFCRLQHPWVLIIDFLNWMAQNSLWDPNLNIIFNYSYKKCGSDYDKSSPNSSISFSILRNDKPSADHWTAQSPPQFPGRCSGEQSGACIR